MDNEKLYAPNDTSGVSTLPNRILIFNNVIDPPDLTMNHVPSGLDGGKIRFTGKARVSDIYTVKAVEFSLNGGSFTGTIPTDGYFDSREEYYYFDFKPEDNVIKDLFGNTLPGHTIRVRSINNNTDEQSRLFHFNPFDLNYPEENQIVNTSYPSFSFSVNRQRIQMRDNLSHYQIQVRAGGEESEGRTGTTSGGSGGNGGTEEPWQNLINNIPVDFRSVKGDLSNLQSALYSSLDTDNGVYETKDFSATYSNDSSTITVYSKTTPISGKYQWRVVAIDKSDKSQETGERNIKIIGSDTTNTTTPYIITKDFPLSILNISGLGNPDISSYFLPSIKNSYLTSSPNPVFYGIAYVNSTVTIKLTDLSCNPSISMCTKSYSTTTLPDSRYGINIPSSDFKPNTNYLITIFTQLNEKLTQLPSFTLRRR